MTANPRSLALYLFAFFTCCYGCRCSDTKIYDPVRSAEYRGDQSAEQRYRPDEILIMYKGIPTPEKRDSIRRALTEAGINPDSVTIRTCNSCNAHVELWQGAEIHTVIHDEGIRAGTVSGGSRGVGEDALARYSLNYLQHLPVDDLPDLSNYRQRDTSGPMAGDGKDTVIVAVLDTGIDPNVVNRAYIWQNNSEAVTSTMDPDSNCYVGDRYGWNFVAQNPDVTDDNVNMHGTLVSDYIIREFESFEKNFPRIMVLKTHDNRGRGDLFSSICAMHYALEKGAKIINASWGFYYYDEDPHSYLDSLITNVMREMGVLFVTASGNKIDAVDAYAQTRYQAEHGETLPDRQLRNLEVHNFYPALLGASDNNVMVATTTNGSTVSPTQNFASRYVDFGVLADTVMPDYMKFQIPFSNDPLFISGSSFAAAILAGKIGAYADQAVFTRDLTKQDIITSMESAASGVIRRSPELNAEKLVSDGRYIERQ